MYLTLAFTNALPILNLARIIYLQSFLNTIRYSKIMLHNSKYAGNNLLLKKFFKLIFWSFSNALSLFNKIRIYFKPWSLSIIFYNYLYWFKKWLHKILYDIRQRKERIIMLWSGSDGTTSKTVFPVLGTACRLCKEKKLQAGRKSWRKPQNTFNLCDVKIHPISRISMTSRDRIISWSLKVILYIIIHVGNNTHTHSVPFYFW